MLLLDGSHLILFTQVCVNDPWRISELWAARLNKSAFRLRNESNVMGEEVHLMKLSLVLSEFLFSSIAEHSCRMRLANEKFYREWAMPE